MPELDSNHRPPLGTAARLQHHVQDAHLGFAPRGPTQRNRTSSRILAVRSGADRGSILPPLSIERPSGRAGVSPNGFWLLTPGRYVTRPGQLDTGERGVTCRLSARSAPRRSRSPTSLSRPTAVCPTWTAKTTTF